MKIKIFTLSIIPLFFSFIMPQQFYAQYRKAQTAILRFELNYYDKNLYIDTVETLDKKEKQFEAFFAKYPHN